jgi:antitoxin VapB
VNSALRAEFTRRKRQQALANLLDRLADERGSLDTPEDDRLLAIGADTAPRLREPFRSAEHGQLFYDQHGLPA